MYIYIYVYTYYIYVHSYIYTRVFCLSHSRANPFLRVCLSPRTSPVPLNSHHASILPVGGRVGEWIMGKRPAVLEGP